MKRSIVSLCLLFITIVANAQFEKGTKYVGSSLSGASLSYNGSDKGCFGLLTHFLVKVRLELFARPIPFVLTVHLKRIAENGMSSVAPNDQPLAKRVLVSFM